MNETETRAEHIDPALAAAGWGVVDGSRIRREYAITQGRLEGFGRRGKSLTADYVLIFRNTKLAVVEAKAWDEPLTLGVAQAHGFTMARITSRFTTLSKPTITSTTLNGTANRRQKNRAPRAASYPVNALPHRPSPVPFAVRAHAYVKRKNVAFAE